jgi:peptidoglycan hydrolase-like protein with peptidoglycan-binding domain
VRFFGFADFARSDGEFGPRTERAVRAAQTDLAARQLYTGKVDGEYGPKSAAAAAKFLAAHA